MERTVGVVNLDELEKGAQDNNGARQDSEAHSDGEADLFALLEKQLADDEPWAEREEDVDYAAVDYAVG